MKYQNKKFAVPMPSEAEAWPFEPKPVRPYCGECDRPADFCDCKKAED